MVTRSEPALGPLVEECAKHGISRSVAYELVASGHLETFKIGAKRYSWWTALARYPGNWPGWKGVVSDRLRPQSRFDRQPSRYPRRLRGRFGPSPGYRGAHGLAHEQSRSPSVGTRGSGPPWHLSAHAPGLASSRLRYA